MIREEISNNTSADSSNPEFSGSAKFNKKQKKVLIERKNEKKDRKNGKNEKKGRKKETKERRKKEKQKRNKKR